MRSGKWYFEVLIVNENVGADSIQFGIYDYKYKRVQHQPKWFQ